jgi:hypothetical protein
MTTAYKKLYDASKREHEKTWEKLRKAERRIEMERMNYAGAMADLDETVATMRKHLLAMIHFLDLNYPK